MLDLIKVYGVVELDDAYHHIALAIHLGIGADFARAAFVLNATNVWWFAPSVCSGCHQKVPQKWLPRPLSLYLVKVT